MNVTIYWVENNLEICELASGNSGNALSSVVAPRGVPVGLPMADAVGIPIPMQSPAYIIA